MFRVLPVAIFIMVGALIFKVAEHKEDVASELHVTPHGEINIEDFEPAAGAPEEDSEDDDHSEDHAEGDEKKGSGHSRDGGAKEGLEALGENESGLPDYVSFTAPEEKLLLISDAEKELLESLKNRRKELDKWESELDLKAGMIEASSVKLDAKISELEKLKMQTQELIIQYQGEEDTKIGSLVKIYESMKPKNAAEVFNQMDIDIMLILIDRMSERKAAPILAKMDTQRAKQITERLATQRSLAEARGIASN